MSVSISPPGPEAPAKRPPREPSLADALAPVVVLIGLLVLTIVLFGTAAADGPLQVALFMSATFAGIIAYKNGYTAVAIEEAAVGGVSSAMGAIFILLAVGALIGTWNLAGTIPTIVSYGLALLRPAIFFAIIAVICALVGAVTGSSWWPAIGGSKRASGRRCERRRCSHFCCHPSRDRRRPPPRLPPRARRGSSRRGAGQRLCVAQELSNRCSGGYRGRRL